MLSDVPLYCAYSNGYETKLKLEANDYEGKYSITYGDGIVNIESLSYCNKAGSAHVVHNFGKGQHKKLIQTKAFYEYVEPLVCGDN